jgi:hypothetical protein
MSDTVIATSTASSVTLFSVGAARHATSFLRLRTGCEGERNSARLGNSWPEGDIGSGKKHRE